MHVLSTRRCFGLLASLAAAFFFQTAQAIDVDGTVTEFATSGGLVERCVRIKPFPGARYSDHDEEAEKGFCALDLEQHALCPKLWSTSPGTVVFTVAGGESGIDEFERTHCGDGHHASDFAEDKPAVFKLSVNGQKTSATYAPSSWVYYHLSRYFQTEVFVPPAVYRSMDREAHHRRVVTPALTLMEGRHARMLSEGWKYLDALETNGLGGTAARQALTDGGRQVFGVLIDNKGDRAGMEVNGTRESGWGDGQNEDFQQTAAYLALRDPASPAEAASASVRKARRNPKMARALDEATPVEQVYAWMQAVMEIALLDTILGQQDRIGNIDERWRWFWVEDGQLKNHSAHGDERPGSVPAGAAWRLKQTIISDNDAGIRPGYTNFAVRTGMLEGLAHFDPRLYQRLGALADALRKGGEANLWLTGAAGLTEREARGIAERSQAAFESLKAQCEAGTLKLDFDLVALLSGDTLPPPASCDLAPLP